MTAIDYHRHKHVHPTNNQRASVTHSHDLGAYDHQHRILGQLTKHEPEHQVPTVKQLEQWTSDGGCEAIDGCWTDADGECEHDKPSWLVALGMI